MKYNDIQFYIASDSRTKSIEIGNLLNRKEKTFFATNDIAEFYAYLKKCTEFTCFIFQLANQDLIIKNIIKSIWQKDPNYPVILLFSQPVSNEKYRNYIRQGISDVLICNSEVKSEEIIEELNEILILKWRAYQNNVEQIEKIYQATVVSLNHEINQPLTVILNAVGLLNAELKSIIVKNAKVKSHFEFIARSTKRIQMILEKLKKLNKVKLIEYTPGVSMIDLEKDIPVVPNLKKIKLNQNNTILLIKENLLDQKLIEIEIKKMGLDIIAIEKLEDAKKIFNQMLYKIQAIVLSDNFPSQDLENTLVELDSEKNSIPVIIVKNNQLSKENTKLLHSNSFQILNRPITPENLQSAISKTVFMKH